VLLKVDQAHVRLIHGLLLLALQLGELLEEKVLQRKQAIRRGRLLLKDVRLLAWVLGLLDERIVYAVLEELLLVTRAPDASHEVALQEGHEAVLAMVQTELLGLLVAFLCEAKK